MCYGGKLGARIKSETGFPVLLLSRSRIERLRKFVQKAGPNSEYYSDMAAFKSAILKCLAKTQPRHKDGFDTLLTPNF